jgi:hypothetical protein
MWVHLSLEREREISAFCTLVAKASVVAYRHGEDTRHSTSSDAASVQKSGGTHGEESPASTATIIFVER